MDAVDMRYKDNIREALQTRNVSKLTELVLGLSESEAQNYIEVWQANYIETMQRIRSSQDTSALETEAHALLNDLLDQVHLSGYNKGL